MLINQSPQPRPLAVPARVSGSPRGRIPEPASTANEGLGINHWLAEAGEAQYLPRAEICPGADH
jgi:hypothetical protein